MISILIGINDVWRRYDGNDPTSAQDFEDGYRQLLTRTREECDAQLVRFDDVFQEALKKQSPDYWAPDGVHPSLAGHGLMAKAWMQAVGV